MMAICLRVTNQGPALSNDTPEPLLQILQEYAGPQVRPFVHQAEVWRRHLRNESTYVVAGTASGKTLAEAVPLFYKLFRAPKEERIRHALWMYPTIALLDDQHAVLSELARKLALDPDAVIGQLHGGMSRTELIAALNKPVILATPDAVYWFFRKNVKYSGLLIYGLALVDEWVLDEAHLFNGLMLHNFEHLWRRVANLAACLDKAPRLHLLTATPTEDLRRLSLAQSVHGKSRSYDVSVELHASGRFDRAERFAEAVNEALEAGNRKALLVCNSARTAHQLFEKYKLDDTSMIPIEHRVQFGRVNLGNLIRWLEKAGIERELIDELGERLLRQQDICLQDLPVGFTLSIPAQDLSARVTGILESACWLVKRTLWQQPTSRGESLDALLHNSRLPCRIVDAVGPRLLGHPVDDAQKAVDEWLADASEALSGIQSDPVLCTARDYTELLRAIKSAGLPLELVEALVPRLRFDLPVNTAWIVAGKLPMRELSHRHVYLRWLNWLIDTEKSARLVEAVRAGMESGQLDVECRHIGLWRGTAVPVIVYSGGMAKAARAGLVNVFSDLERAVLISTSAVEVGVDFHADVLITEECEGNSFLQRFGRVGRHEAGSKVIAFVSGDVYAALGQLADAYVDRERFAAEVVGAFPQRRYADSSQLVDATHYLINEQLGRISERLNVSADLAAARPLADQMRAADIRIGFGLRGTMPQITLRDGVAKDPFYLLRYIDAEDLRPADSPFEVARTDKWFTNLVFEKAKFDITTDLEQSLKASQHLFSYDGGSIRIRSQAAIGLTYLRKMNEYFATADGWSIWNRWNFLMLYGDVYLLRVDRAVQHAEPVVDRERNPLYIPGQIYLVLWGWNDASETRALLQGAGVADWEELHYDWEGLQLPAAKAIVILEHTAGACLAAYRRILDYVDHRV